MGGRGSWTKRDKNWQPPQGGASGKESDQLRPLISGGSQRNTLDNFRRVIGDSDVEYSAVMDAKGRAMGTVYRGGRHSTSVDTSYAFSHKESTTIHNHPDKHWGGTFSDADLKAHSVLGNKRIVATAKEGTYHMIRTNKTDYAAFGRAYNKAEPKLYAEWQRKWADISSKKTFKTAAAREKAERQVFVGVYHKWFKENASQYGLNYVFEKSAKMGKRSAVNINKTYKDWYGQSDSIYGE